MPLLLYTITAAALLWLAHRFVRPLSRWAALILYLLPFALAGYALIANRVWAPVDLPYQTVPLSWMKSDYAIADLSSGIESDVYTQAIPWRKAAQWSLARGEWGLYNPFILSGDILLASEQPAIDSPVMLIAALLPAALSFTFTGAITLFIAGLTAFLFARELGCLESSALIASAGWMFASGFVLFLHWSMSATWAWCPLVLAGVHRVVLTPTMRSGAILTAALAMMLFAGHPETTLHAVFLGLIYGCFELALHRANALRTIGIAIGAGIVALLLFAIRLLPFLEAAPQTMEYATRSTMHARAATASGPETGAVGIIVLALAIYAIVRVRSAHTWFFTAIALFGLLAHAKWAPVEALLQHLPLLNMTLNERLVFGTALALAMLAAIGVEHLPRRAPVALLLGLIIAERFVSDGNMHHSFTMRQAYPPIPILQPLKSVTTPFRITGHGLAFIPGTSALYELEDVRGYTALTFLRYRETYPLWCIHQNVWFNRVDDLTRPFLSFLNVRYAITWDRDPPPPGWREVARQRGSILIENMRVLERIFVPRTVRFSSNVLAEMTSETDFRERAWIEAALPPHERMNGPGRVSFTRRRLGYTVDAQMDGGGWIVTSIPAWKGWRAYVDGRRVKTQFANHAFVAAYVPQGRHRVELTYWPESFVIGRAITIWTLLIVIALMGWTSLHRR